MNAAPGALPAPRGANAVLVAPAAWASLRRVPGVRVQRLHTRQARQRKRIGRVTVVIAAMLLALLPALRTPDVPAESLRLDHRAGSPGAAPVAGAQDDPIGAVGSERLPPITLPEGDQVALGRVAIPRLRVESPFFNGVHEQVLEQGIGHWPGTPQVGEAGNAVLSGHRTTHTAPFGDLDLLEPGDEVRIEVGNNRVLAYEVIGTRIVAEEQYVDVVLEQPRSPDEYLLTMFACHPKGSAEQRIIVQARLK